MIAAVWTHLDTHNNASCNRAIAIPTFPGMEARRCDLYWIQIMQVNTVKIDGEIYGSLKQLDFTFK